MCSVTMTLFSEMKTFHMILLLTILIVITDAENLLTTTAVPEMSEQSEPSTSVLSNLRMKIVSKDCYQFLDLKKTNQLLANKHLPIWILSSEVSDRSKSDKTEIKLKPVPQVMNELGEFTMYQEPETTSAAVYFHRTRKFSGIIDHRYLIQELSIDDIDNLGENEFWIDNSAIISRKKSVRNYPQNRKWNNQDEEMSRASESESKTIKIKREQINHGYPEILVVVSCELAYKLMETDSKFEMYTSVVSYVLTLFNAVDMLYSKLKDTKIELNLAGIIIDTECESLAFMAKCYTQTSDVKEDKRQMMNTICTNRELRQYLEDNKKILPMQSYDIAVFLTSNKLYYFPKKEDANGEKTIKFVRGQARRILNDFYQMRKLGADIILPATIMADKNLKNYADVAHEMAHLMNLSHDKPLLKTGDCNSNIMKTGGSWCRTCLTWSESSEEQFKTFFSSPGACTFINKPRSLHPPGRRRMLTADEQCQCYHHEFGVETKKVIQKANQKYCETPLLCKGYDKQLHYTVIPMDGTPCNSGKVCWKKHCEKIKDF